MKVVIINMTNGGISGGYRKYLLNIIPRLAANSNIRSLLCVSPKLLQVHSWFGALKKVEFVNCPSFGLLKFKFNNNLKRKLKEFSPDLIFIPVARYFEFPGVPILNMVQNILPFLYKELKFVSLSEKICLCVKYLASVKAIKRSERTIVTSKFVKDFLIKRVGISEEKISLIYFGRDSQAENIDKPDGATFGEDKKFLFTAGSLESYRGIEDIIGAWKYLKNDFSNLKILIAGKARAETQNYHKKLLKLIRLVGLENNIVWLGQLSQGELLWCYQNCAAFVITSRMETFGLVALEAMSNGCLCIAAENSPFPEIFLDAARYYCPRNSHSLAGAIQDVLGWSRVKKIEMADKAKKRAEYFSWDKAADGLIREFKASIEENKRFIDKKI